MRAKIDWLALEAAIRLALRDYARTVDAQHSDAGEALQRISDALGDFTGRGYEFDRFSQR
jgi:hypothetical protein